MNLRMGGFHACCSFVAVIGICFGDAGLKDLLIESGLDLVDGTVEEIMKGKQYNNATRIHHVTAESLPQKKKKKKNRCFYQMADRKWRY